MNNHVLKDNEESFIIDKNKPVMTFMTAIMKFCNSKQRKNIINQLKNRTPTENVTILWLDDIRNPFVNDNCEIILNEIKNTYLEYLNQKDPDSYIDFEINWVTNYHEFISWIEKRGLPNYISFDHDLADEHYVPSHLWDDYEKSKEFQNKQNYKEKTGLDCAKWLVEYCIDYNKELPFFNVHSANPVGADNIKTLLDNFNEKYLSFKSN